MAGGFSSKRNMANGRAIGTAPNRKLMPATIATAQYISTTERNIRENKMGFFKRKLRDWLFADEQPDMVIASSDSDHDLRGDNTLTFHVIPASGGRIVQVRKYDSRKDQHITTLHIITPDEDIPTSLAHILAIEKLSQ